MADSNQRLFFDIFARDRDASRTFKKVGDSADKAGDSIGGVGDDAKNLDQRLDETRRHLHGLIAEFDRTGDADLFKGIRKDRSTLNILQAMRKELQGAEKDGAGLGDVLGSLPSQLKGAAIVGLGGAAALAAPAVGAAIGGAVIGAVGAGGIIGGIAAASADPRVKAAGVMLGENLLDGFKGKGEVFVGPLLASFQTLTQAGDEFVDEIGDGFAKMAPLIRPLAEGIKGLVDNFGPGLSDAFSAAQPVIRALANELPEIGDALGDMFSSIAEEGDGATEGMLTLLHTIEFLARATGDFIGTLEWEYQGLVKVGAGLDDLNDKVPALAAILGGGFSVLTDEAQNLQDGLGDASKANHDFYLTMLDTKTATDGSTQALRDHASALLDQFDPTANLIHRLEDSKRAQDDYNEAVRRFGPHSQQARDAELRQAEAILAANAAAATAAGTFGGRFPEALRKTLIEGGLTEDQLKDIEKRARAAHTALDQYADVYKATVILDQEYHREEARQHRASGGPVMADRSYIVGENGPELVTFGANGYVHNAGATRSMMSGGGGSTRSAGREPARVELYIYGDDDELVRRIRRSARVIGGGDVQVAFGQP